MISGTKILWLLVLFKVTMFISAPSYAHALNIEAFGIRGGIDLKHAERTPTDISDFYKADIYLVHALPWSWQYSSGWEASWRLNSAGGILRGKGDTAIIAELGPSIAFSKPSWRLVADIGTGLAALSRHHFGSQDMGGPFQIVGHWGVGFDLGSNLVVGCRLYHLSDARIYGTHSRGVDMMLLDLSYHF